jgi:BMFP domain-containing protein YqiC
LDRHSFLQDFQQRVLDMFRASPAADLERNLKALVSQTFNRLELVTRDEFDTQREMLEELSTRVAALESATAGATSPDRSGLAPGSEADASRAGAGERQPYDPPPLGPSASAFDPPPLEPSPFDPPPVIDPKGSGGSA